MSGLIGRKIGMTSLFDEKGKNIPCTVLEVGPCVVTQVKPKRLMGMMRFNWVSIKRQKKEPPMP